MFQDWNGLDQNGITQAVTTIVTMMGIGAGAVGAIAIAELGRRRARGTEVFPAAASAFAPLWLLERALCSWLALGSRVEVTGRQPFGDLALSLAIASFAGSLLLARFLQRLPDQEEP